METLSLGNMNPSTRARLSTGQRKIMKNIKNVSRILFIIIAFFSVFSIASAADVNLTIRDGATVIFSGAVPLQPSGNINLNDSNGRVHSLNADSVLSLLNDADIASSNFSISNLIYYDSYGSFYLKCINDSLGDRCDDWQYLVNDSYSSVGMDQSILSGGENVYVYFGPQNKIVLSSSNINTLDTLTATAQKYDYQNNTWIIRTGVTVGLTQPDPNNPWSPTEIQTQAVDGSGRATFSLVPLGNYDIGIKEDFYFPTEALKVVPPPPEVAGGGNAVATPIVVPVEKPKFDTKKAFDFLNSQQHDDGSYGEDLYTDWVAVALAPNGNQDAKNKLSKYLLEDKMLGASLTDFERHSIALMSLGINPYDVNGENFIQKIIKNFDGKQFGDATIDNDDIFALIVLQNAGFTTTDKIIEDDITFILNRQKENGSWDNSVDMTGAGIGALSFAKEDEKVKNALAKAKDFLKQKQKDNGGWENVSSTAWAMEGILALSEKIEDWTKNGNTPMDYLAKNQDSDGGVRGENQKNRIWETSYALIALSGKTWNEAMSKFEKPKIIPIVVKTREVVKKQENKKTKKIKVSNLASAITAVNDIKTPEKIITPTPHKNWFQRLLSTIFGF